MIKRGVISVLIFLLLVSPLVTAYYSTNIKVKTLPFHEVQVTPFNANVQDFQALEKFINYSDQYGDITFSFNPDVQEFNIVIFIKDLEGETVITRKYMERYQTGEDVYIEIAPSSFEFIKTPEQETEAVEEQNESLLLSENQTEEELEAPTNNEEPDKSITGFSVFGEDSLLSNYKYYLIGFVMLIAIAGGVVLKHKYKSPGKDEGVGGVAQKFKVTKLSELKERKEESLDEMDQQIKDAEEKIKQAQKVIDQLKKQEEIKKAEKKLEEDRKALEKLKDIREDIEDKN